MKNLTNVDVNFNFRQTFWNKILMLMSCCNLISFCLPVIEFAFFHFSFHFFIFLFFEVLSYWKLKQEEGWSENWKLSLIQTFGWYKIVFIKFLIGKHWNDMFSSLKIYRNRIFIMYFSTNQTVKSAIPLRQQ